MDEEDRKVQNAILDRDQSTNPSTFLKKSLSSSYPNVPFDEALKKEREKLQMELERSCDLGQSEMIQHLIGVTQNVETALEEKSAHLKSPKKVELKYSDSIDYKEKSFDGTTRLVLFFYMYRQSLDIGYQKKFISYFPSLKCQLNSCLFCFYS